MHRLLGVERVHDGQVDDRSFASLTAKGEFEEFVQTIVFPGSGNQAATEPSIIPRPRARGSSFKSAARRSTKASK